MAHKTGCTYFLQCVGNPVHLSVGTEGLPAHRCNCTPSMQCCPLHEIRLPPSTRLTLIFCASVCYSMSGCGHLSSESTNPQPASSAREPLLAINTLLFPRTLPCPVPRAERQTKRTRMNSRPPHHTTHLTRERAAGAATLEKMQRASETTYIAEVSMGTEDKPAHLTVGGAAVDLFLVLLRNPHPELPTARRARFTQSAHRPIPWPPRTTLRRRACACARLPRAACSSSLRWAARRSSACVALGPRRRLSKSPRPARNAATGSTAGGRGGAKSGGRMAQSGG